MEISSTVVAAAFPPSSSSSSSGDPIEGGQGGNSKDEQQEADFLNPVVLQPRLQLEESSQERVDFYRAELIDASFAQVLQLLSSLVSQFIPWQLGQLVKQPTFGYGGANEVLLLLDAAIEASFTSVQECALVPPQLPTSPPSPLPLHLSPRSPLAVPASAPTNPFASFVPSIPLYSSSSSLPPPSGTAADPPTAKPSKRKRKGTT